jgi:hypothetical protein
MEDEELQIVNLGFPFPASLTREHMGVYLVLFCDCHLDAVLDKFSDGSSIRLLSTSTSVLYRVTDRFPTAVPQHLVSIMIVRTSAAAPKAKYKLQEIECLTFISL